MLNLTCVEKIRDKHNNITDYRLIDGSGQNLVAESEQLKAAIRADKIHVFNLKLTSDNRLVNNKYIDKKNEKKEDVQGFINKAKVLGFSHIEELETYCHHKIYFLSKANTHILYIPEDVSSVIICYNVNADYFKKLRTLDGDLKVIGGKNLIHASYLLADCSLSSIDLARLNPKNLISTDHMFFRCTCNRIKFSGFDTSSVDDMYGMFVQSNINEMDLESINTSQVTRMTYMFHDCKCPKLNFSNFDTSKVTHMDKMFAECITGILDLSTFDTSKVLDMNLMFFDCKAKKLDISSFDTSNVKSMSNMFKSCEIKIVLAKTFDISDDIYITEIFNYSSIEEFYVENLAGIEDLLTIDDLVNSKICFKPRKNYKS